MNYPQSQEILEEVKKSKRILLNCHANPDADSVGSALAMADVLNYFKKEFSIICPSDVPENLQFLEERYQYKISKVDFEKFDFKKWDLFIVLDTASWGRVTGLRDLKVPDIPIVVVDHHKTNEAFGKINIVDENMAANCELLYFLFQDWGVEVDIEVGYPALATALLTGILGDTGALRFPEADTKTFKVALELEKQTDKDEIIRNLYQNYSLEVVKFWGEVLKGIQLDEECKFVWSAIPMDIYQRYKKPVGAKSEIADLIFQNVKDTDFGIVMLGGENRLDVSLRSRTGKDVSVLASALGGGGHRWAAAAKVYGLPFDKAVEKVLAVAREYANKHKKAS